MLLSTDASVRAQHEAVRNAAGWYDFTHFLLQVTGEDATALLDKMYVSSIAKVKIGGAKYTIMLNEDGIIVDDVVVFRLEDNNYWISTLHIRTPMKWLDENKGASQVKVKDITTEWSMYSVQGPNARDFVNSVVAERVDDQKFFTISDNKIGDIPVKIARSGFTGERWGYEIYCAPKNATFVEARLAENESAFGAMKITEIDVMARTLPTEKGFVLLTDIYDANPLEAGFERAVDWSKDFAGKAALERVREGGAKRQLLGFTVDDLDARIYGGPKGAPIVKDGEVVGKATKFTYGATVGKNIGFALVDIAKAKVSDKVTINGVEAVLTERLILK